MTDEPSAEVPGDRPARRRRRTQLKQTDTLRMALSGLAEVRDPGEAEEPILSPFVRQAIVEWLVELRSVEALEAVKVKPRTTALLYGPPGCGKTTLAHHLAARLGIPLVCVGAENIFSSGFGDSERNAARLFNALGAADTPSVVLLDEIDSVGGKRVAESPGGGGANAARSSTLNVLLRRIEDFNGVLIGATNLSANLDPALWRRFGMQIEVGLPGADERYAILCRYAEPFGFDADGVELLTDLTEGAAPSLLRQLMEGVKRLLTLGGRLGVDVGSPIAVFGAVIAQTRPHPDVPPPLLWSSPSALKELAALAWPPGRLLDGASS